jgi:opacity protein-like surface antigen
MQSRAVSVLITACFIASVHRADAQIVYNSGSVPSRFSFGGDVVISQPKGEFANNVPNGYGIDLTGMFRVDPRGYLNIRADFGAVQYGEETQRVNFLPTTGRVGLEVKTGNQIGFGSIGAQLQIPDGWFRPYANAAFAPTYFWTSSSISGTDNSGEFASTTNQDDWSHAWVFGGGLMIPFGKTIGALNLGAKYFYGGEATYLREGDITDNPNGTITLNPRRSKTDLVLWQLGVSFKIPRPSRR